MTTTMNQTTALNIANVYNARYMFEADRGTKRIVVILTPCQTETRMFWFYTPIKNYFIFLFLTVCAPSHEDSNRSQR